VHNFHYHQISRYKAKYSWRRHACYHKKNYSYSIWTFIYDPSLHKQNFTCPIVHEYPLWLESKIMGGHRVILHSKFWEMLLFSRRWNLSCGILGCDTVQWCTIPTFRRIMLLPSSPQILCAVVMLITFQNTLHEHMLHMFRSSNTTKNSHKVALASLQPRKYEPPFAN